MQNNPTNQIAPAKRSPRLQFELVFRLNVTQAEAFDLLSTRMPEWFSAIHGVRWNHEKSISGPGALGACSERVCDFGGRGLVETIVAFKPGRHYAYSVDMDRSEMKMPLFDHLGTVDVSAITGGSRIVWRQHFRPRWFVPAAMLRWQMRDKMMRPAIQTLIDRFGGAWLTSENQV